MNYVIAAVLLCILAHAGSAIIGPGEIGERALTFIGTYNGRSFFQAENNSSTHAGSKTRCSSQGMVLAKITSEAQKAYLRPLLPSIACFWTSAEVVPAYTWLDGTSVTVTHASDSPTCLAILKERTPLEDLPCSAGCFTLCMTP